MKKEEEIVLTPDVNAIETIDAIMIAMSEPLDTRAAFYQKKLLPGLARFRLDDKEYIIGALFKPQNGSKFSNLGTVLDDPAAVDEALKSLPYFSQDVGELDEEDRVAFRENILPALHLPHFSQHVLDDVRESRENALAEQEAQRIYDAINSDGKDGFRPMAG